MAEASNYCRGVITKDQLYELRVDGVVAEQGQNVVDLYWKARRSVNGNPDARAEVEAISGYYVCATFSDATLRDWERT